MIMDINGVTPSTQQVQTPRAADIPTAPTGSGGEEQAEGGRVDNENAEGGQAPSQPGVGGSVNVKA